MKFLKGLALALLVIVLFVSTSGILVLYPVKNIFDKDNIQNTISNFEIEEMIEQSPDFKEAVNELFEPIFDQARELGIKDEVVLKIIDSKEVKNFVGNITCNIVDYYLTGNNQKIINIDNIESLVGQVMDDIDESGFYQFKTEERDEILQAVREQATEYEDLIPDTDVLDEGLEPEQQDTLQTVRFIMGSELITYLFLGAIVSFLAIVAIKWKELRWMKYSSITWIVNSSLAFLGTLLLSMIIHWVNVDSYILAMIDNVFKLSYTLSISLLVVSIIMLVVYNVLANKRKAREVVKVEVQG